VELRADKTNTLLLLLASISVCWGYAILCVLEKIPFSAFFWNENLLRPILFTSWESWISDYANGSFLKVFSMITGIWLLAAGFAILWIRQFPRTAYFFVISGTVVILKIAVLFGVEKIFFAVQFAEHMLQWGSPLFIVIAWRHTRWPPKLITFMKASVAITFAAHGLYALDVFPRPGHFVAMIMTILDLKEGAAIQFLNLAGWLDLIVAAMVWIPLKGLQRPALFYMVIWGTLTTLARWVAHVHPHLPWWGESMAAWTPEVMVRLPHILVPLVLWRVLSAGKSKKSG